MEQWKINRAGLINFWYYDEAEFSFENGRMLLRGANGSGKSVTMQSLVPLLFDGNKAPERLDPFGSRARKMESYLLSEGLDLEERIGYLYLEFAKPEAGRFMTIGMGMRARKNMPLQTWYFIIRDNTRIGKNLDFQLYREIGEKIPLTERELKNRLGEGNSVYSNQKEYKGAVNECLFGFQDLSDFDELIELLIQIRSPKLSKEFKPTTMYEIMQNSLITLSDEDLRPMSEAIEHMDEIKLKVEALEESRNALNRIGLAYDRYNTHMLALKAKARIKAAENREEGDRKLEQIGKELSDTRENLEKSKRELEVLTIEFRSLQAEQSSMGLHDLQLLMEEKQGKEEELRDRKILLNSKEQRLEMDQQRLRELENKLRDSRLEIEGLQKEIQKLLSEMETAATEAAFDEHSFFQDEYRRQENRYSFDHLERERKKHTEGLRLGEKLLTDLERMQQEYQQIQQEVERLKQEKEKAERGRLERERLLNEIRAEFAESLFAWDKKNQIFHPNPEAMETAAGRVFLYHTPFSFHEVKEPVADSFHQWLADNTLQDRSKEKQWQESIEEGKTLERERDQLRETKDPEPPRPGAVQRNRQQLRDQNIPFIPLYLALEFDKDCSDGLRNTIEEALLDLGILDALIIDPAYQEQVLQQDWEGADKYIFADPGFFAHDISLYLQAETQESGITLQQVEDVIKSIWLTEDQQKLFITEGGQYGLGILRGKTSGEYQSRFLGQKARKQYKNLLLEQLSEEIKTCREQQQGLKREWEEIKSRRVQAEEEWSRFPGEQDLKTAWTEYHLAREEEERIQRELKGHIEKSDHLYREVQQRGLEIKEKLGKISLLHKASAFAEGLDQMELYTESLTALKMAEQQKASQEDSMGSMEEQSQDLIDRISETIGEQGDLDRQIRTLEIRLMDIQKQLALSGNAELLKRVEAITLRLGEIPEEMNRINLQTGGLEERSVTLDRELEGQRILQHKWQQQEYLYEKIFDGESQLAYVEKHPADPQTGLLAAHRILKNYGAILEEKKPLSKRGEELQEAFNYQSGALMDYNLKRIDLFSGLLDWDRLDWEILELSMDEVLNQTQRMDIRGKFMGREVRFYELSGIVEEQIKENRLLLDEQDRALFEDILINSISRKIRAKIEHSKRWVEKINQLMMGMNTSSSITFSLNWTEKRAQGENQLGTRELVEILRMDQNLLTQEHKNRMMEHFRARIAESRLRSADQTDHRSFLTIMKEILDYRQWFEFQLFYKKSGTNRKEMTNTAFFTFSGGEKAMAMYVPLFAAVYAKYQGGGADCPRVVSLDEAFAGVDEKNINDMFRLMVELDLSFMANSQVLYGDYETVPGLSIYELIRPENLTYVTVIPYRWNGRIRELVTE